MSFLDAIADDYKIVDGAETITLTPVGRSPAVAPSAVEFASADDYTLKEIAAAEGLFQVGDRKWLLGANQLPATVRPQPGDMITQADGAVWVLIAEPALDAFGVSWVCPSRRGT